MKMRSFYLFYLLAALLLVFGFLTGDMQTVDTTWGMTVIVGMWSFFLPFAIGALFMGIVYQFCFMFDRTVRNKMVIIHFVLVLAGLLFSFNVYRMSTVIMAPTGDDMYAIESGTVPFYMFLAGPVLLIASFVVFVIGLVRTRKNAA